MNWKQKPTSERLIHWGPRTLDLDILFYDNEIIDIQICIFHTLICKIEILFSSQWMRLLHITAIRY